MSYRRTSNQNTQKHTRKTMHAANRREYDRLDAEATRLVGQGKTDEEIAEILGISVDQAWVFTIRKRG